MPGTEGTPTVQAEAAGQHQERGLGQFVHAVGHIVGEGAHIVVEGVSALLTPYSRGTEVAVASATAARREGDKVNPYTVDVSGFVNTNHRT